MTYKISTFCILTMSLLMSFNLDARFKEIPLDNIPLEVTDGVIFAHNIFSKKDCKKYLKSSKVLRKGYQPIQITVMNNTQTTIEISPKNFSDYHVSALEVSEKIHRNSCARGVGFAIPGVIIGAPVAFVSVYAGSMAVAMGATSSLLIFFLPALAIMSPFIITAIVQGCGTQDFNEKIDEIYVHKELRKQTLCPGEIVSGLLFVPHDKVAQDFMSREFLSK